MVYLKFFDEGWTMTTYSYFIRVWNERCPNILLKKSMRFARCSFCICALEALDSRRITGGTDWMDDDMKQISRALNDHYAVSAVGKIYSITVVFPSDLFESHQLKV